jgi:hypothetical protein
LNLASFLGYLHNVQFISQETFSSALYTLIHQLSSVEHVIAIRDLLAPSRAKFPPHYAKDVKKAFTEAVAIMLSLGPNRLSLRGGLPIEALGVNLEEIVSEVLRIIDGGIVLSHMLR